MAEYRYLTADLLTGTILAELPLADVTLNLKLNAAGGFSGKLPIADPRVQALNPVNATRPGRTALYVDRDGVLLWGGIIWSRQYDSSNGVLQLAGAEFESYFSQRLISTDAVFVAQEQLAIVRSLIATSQAVTAGSIGVALGTETSGVLRDRTYYGYQLLPVLQCIQEMARQDSGFDFGIDVAYSGNAITKTLRLGYPRRGVIANLSGFVFEHPGNVQSYNLPEDASTQATTIYATGAGVGPGQALAVASNADVLAAGYPVLEYKSSHVEVDDPVALQQHANAEAKALKYPLGAPEITVRGDLDPVIGSYTTGDELRLRITDDRYPGTNTAAGFDGHQRITNIMVRPPGSSSNEAVTLTLGQVVP